jgi:AraC-like DNA-binding protein
MFSQLACGLPDVEDACHFMMLALLSIFNRIISSNMEQDQSKKPTDLRILGHQIKEYIDENYYEDLSLATIADAMNLSTYYLSHVFKKYIGYSPMQYTLRRRIGEAQTLLITTDDSITDVASQVGYGNPNYFNVIFTKNIGMSPSQYRKSYTRKS